MIKSVGNSITAYRDLENEEDVRMILCVLCESVASRMRSHGLMGRTLSLSVRDNRLYSFERQMVLQRNTWSAEEMMRYSFQLFCRHWKWERPIRSLGVRMSELCGSDAPDQICLFTDYRQLQRQESIEKTVEQLRRRFGPHCIDRAVVLQDRRLTGAGSERNRQRPAPVGSQCRLKNMEGIESGAKNLCGGYGVFWPGWNDDADGNPLGGWTAIFGGSGTGCASGGVHQSRGMRNPVYLPGFWAGRPISFLRRTGGLWNPESSLFWMARQKD